MNRAGLEVVVQNEWAGKHVADGIDEAHNATSTAKVETRKRFAECREMEERIAGEHLGTGQKPVVELNLLCLRRMQVVPGVDAATRRTETGEPKFCAVFVRKRFVRVDLFDIFASHDDGKLELTEVGIAQMVHGGANSGVGAFTAHRVIGYFVDTIKRDLNVDVVHRRQTLGGFGGDATTVGRELHADAFFDAVLDDLEEVGAQHWFATTDVDVEHLHLGELVDNGLHLLGGQLVGIATAR